MPRVNVLCEREIRVLILLQNAWQTENNESIV